MVFEIGTSYVDESGANERTFVVKDIEVGNGIIMIQYEDEADLTVKEMSPLVRQFGKTISLA